MIRAAIPADAPAIAAIWNAVIALPHITFTTDTKSDAAVAQLIVERAGAFWVAERAGTVAGFATFGSFRGGPGYRHTAEHSVMLGRDARGHGMGRALMAAVESGAVVRDVHLLVAGISGGNPDAVAFHDRLGFAQSGKIPQAGRKGGQWYDLILMHKLLFPS
ncbi:MULTISPECIES: GNAT family N-acetyltransferase [Roseobacteraceae]|uniref:L-amino acid N-acyltransferase MnaT n=1 Tax=Pseudosulfitobacter pseudonitzschiae TaxID=1402135 RepID=A0A221JXP7_9RHOB|nr:MULTISPECIES: GNAT family N-acetyltransferase [Roseobacteraceae]ASM71496.1 L-amino acid N-acyltransferase MnaT [Pseudosulfitobacter pseudonitzschiae]